MTNLSDIRDIQFGLASAEQEGANEPHLLLEGFYDAQQLTVQLRSGAKFLVLGYKGSGKSALGERLRLLAESDPQLFVTSTPLNEFPFSTFTRMLRSAAPADPDTQYPAMWTWILLLMALQSLASDEAMSAPPEVAQAFGQLQKLGLLPAESLGQLVRRTSKSSVKVAIPSIGELARETEGVSADDLFYQFVENLKALVLTCTTQNTHVLVLDGLDEILSLKATQYHVLGALLLVVGRLNALLRQSSVPLTFVLLCRTDLFTKLPAPNKNKVRQDSAIELDWYHDPKKPGEAALIKLANLRGRLSAPEVSDVFEQFFPKTIAGRDVRAFLCEHTRHTPRDFLQLLTHIQKYAYPGRLAREVILKGLREYSIGYFLPEIRDELVGFVSVQQADKLFSFLGSLRTREFTLPQVEAFARKNLAYKDLDLRAYMELLFDCSAIGNVDPRRGYYWFKFRNVHSAVNLGEVLVLHPGLWKAFNVADGSLPTLDG
jgi:hypothetical protein